MYFTQQSDLRDLDTEYFNSVLGNIYPQINVVFVSIKGDNTFDAFEEEGVAYLRIPTGYKLEEMTRNLLDALTKMTWLDHKKVKEDIEAILLQESY